MSNRVQLGLRGGTYGLWISKPGKDVTTAKKGDLLFDSTAQGFGQIVKSGVVSVTFGSPQSIYFTLPSGTFAIAEVTIPFLGTSNFNNYPSSWQYLRYEVEENGASSRLILTNTLSSSTLSLPYVVYAIALGDL
jgi:hypothetical protein